MRSSYVPDQLIGLGNINIPIRKQRSKVLDALPFPLLFFRMAPSLTKDCMHPRAGAVKGRSSRVFRQRLPCVSSTRLVCATFEDHFLKHALNSAPTASKHSFRRETHSLHRTSTYHKIT